MRNFIDSLKARRDAAKNEGGFSLIDVVVTVAIIVALSVGGFVTYTGIVENAKSAATAAAADQVFTALTVNANDGGLEDPVKAYNDSSNGVITVEWNDTNSNNIFDKGDSVVATHKDAGTGAGANQNLIKTRTVN